MESWTALGELLDLLNWECGEITGRGSIDKGQKVQSRLLQVLGQVWSHVEYPGIVAEAPRSSMRRDNVIVESRIVEL
jgi:hypothetical protein